MLDYHVNLVEPRTISTLQDSMVESQDDQVQYIDTNSIIASISRTLDPRSLGQDIEKSYDQDKDSSFDIKDGSFVYSIKGLESVRKHGPISTQVVNIQGNG